MLIVLTQRPLFLIKLDKLNLNEHFYSLFDVKINVSPHYTFLIK